MVEIGDRLSQVIRIEASKLQIESDIMDLSEQVVDLDAKVKLVDIYHQLALLKQNATVKYYIQQTKEQLESLQHKSDLIDCYNKISLVNGAQDQEFQKAHHLKKIATLDEKYQEVINGLQGIDICPTCGTHLSEGIKCS